MSPAKKASKSVKSPKQVKAPPKNDSVGSELDTNEMDVTSIPDPLPTAKSPEPPKKEEILEEVTDEDLDFSFVTEAAKREDAANAGAPVPIVDTKPSLVTNPDDADLDESELADMQAAISENIQKAEVSGQAPLGIPSVSEGSVQVPPPEGTIPPTSEGAQHPPVPLEPLTAEKLQPATEQILDMHRHMRELVRELNNNLNMINNDRLKDVLQKLTIDIQAEEETLKDYNAQTAAFLSAIVDNKLQGDERTFKEREIRKVVANAYEEHRECTDHAKQLTDLLQALAEDESLPADQKGLLSALDTTFIVELADRQQETFQGILDTLQINLEDLLKQKNQLTSGSISNELQQKIEDEMRLKAEAAALPPVSREEFIQYVSSKRDKIWYHAIWYLIFSVDDHVATKKALFDALSAVTSKSAIDDVKENVFYFGLGPLLKLRLEDANVVRYRDQTFRLNMKAEKISEVLQVIGEPVSPRPQISAETQKDMIDKFLGDDFLDI
ncbi:MAG: hypothetical protein RBG13Loki_0297 [Promethearchaeota archaeon CR_4]|nr:MAG: hypothetical protein RBG13Loki_0297 [Candidatus Lokiarchaeota archaeon CR_4]